MTVSRNPDYADIDLGFFAHPTTGDVMRLKGPEAIKRSIRNLIFTNFYDHPFRSYIGSNAIKLLFENINPLTANFLVDAIEEVINNYEPRVKLTKVTVKFDPENNGYNVTLEYIILNRGEPVITSLFLERIR